MRIARNMRRLATGSKFISHAYRTRDKVSFTYFTGSKFIAAGNDSIVYFQEQEVDFQKHDETLRNEIANLQRQISALEKSKNKNMKKSDSKTSMNSINHPLNRSDDSAIDIEELEKNLGKISS